MLVPFAGCGEESTDDAVVGSVPANARAYLHLDRGSDDWEAARDSLAQAARDRERAALAPVGPGRGSRTTARPASRCCPVATKPVVLTPDDPPRSPASPSRPTTRRWSKRLPDQRLATLYLARSATRSLQGHRPDDHDRRRRRRRGRRQHADPRARAAPRRPRSVQRHQRRRAARGRRSGGRVLSRAPVDRVRRSGRSARRFEGVERGGETLRACGRETGRRVVRRRAAAAARPPRRADREPRQDGAPVLTFILDDVDEEEALDVLARLRPR